VLSVAALVESPHFAALPRALLEQLADASEEADVDEGQVVYDEASGGEYFYLVLSGTVRVRTGARAGRRLGPGHSFGADPRGAPRSHGTARMDRAGSILRIPVDRLAEIWAQADGSDEVDPAEPVWRALPASQAAPSVATRIVGRLKSPRFLGALAGYVLFATVWYLAVEVLALPRFAKLPGITSVVREWTSRDPVFGLSIYTPVYYDHIWTSLRRIAIAFGLATALGVPVGLLLGWSTTFREYVFPVFEVLRPIPILAWVPLAIIVFPGSETPVVFLTFLASFFATALNTQLGVRSIEPQYVLAAQCLGASRWQTFWHVIVPGSLPSIFTGLQVSVGVAWFSLAAAEMVSGQFGLGYLINTSYTLVQYPTIVIGMLTLGLVGLGTSAAVRLVGDRLMKWRMRELALGRT
jgi:NitT/TauT family transport system permease protein